jgi:hypothetical protein
MLCNLSDEGMRSLLKLCRWGQGCSREPDSQGCLTGTQPSVDRGLARSAEWLCEPGGRAGPGVARGRLAAPAPSTARPEATRPHFHSSDNQEKPWDTPIAVEDAGRILALVPLVCAR